MADERLVDEHLVAVLNEVLDAVYQAKQAAWSASMPGVRAELQALVSFLIDQSGRLMLAEERIDGRSDAVSSPSSHQRGNLLSDADGNLEGAVTMLTRRLEALADDAHRRADAIAAADEATLLHEIAEGLEVRIHGLRSHWGAP